MKPSLFLIILLIFPPVVSVFGYLFLVQSVAKTSKNYRLFILKLKKQGKYEEWAHQHKNLVLLEMVSQYIKTSFIVLVLVGFVMRLASIPKVVVTVIAVIGYIYWPLVFILMITLSKLYNQVPELQS